MKRLELLKLLLEREQKRRDEAQAAFGAATQNAQAQTAQADGLVTYRTDYCKKWAAQFQVSATMEILRCYQGFSARLEQAISQQQNVAAHASRGVEAARQRLMEKEIRVATVERLILRRQQLLARVQDKRDQKNLDEMAARRKLPKELAGMA